MEQASGMGAKWASINCCLMSRRGTGKAPCIVNDMMETMNIGICTGETLVASCKHKSHTYNCILYQCSLVALTLNSLLIRPGEFWFVSSEVGKKVGSLKSKTEKEEDRLTPPLHGWQYRGGGKWNSDATLVCSREVSTPCREVGVDFKQIERR